VSTNGGGPDVSGNGQNAKAVNDAPQEETVKPPACDKAAWVFAGLSMAGWNALISAGLTGLSLAAAFRERSRP